MDVNLETRAYEAGRSRAHADFLAGLTEYDPLRNQKIGSQIAREHGKVLCWSREQKRTARLAWYRGYREEYEAIKERLEIWGRRA